jgi:preprotein translocase subunit SecY
MGIKGVPPGEETIKHLKLKTRQVKFWGGLAMAFLAVIAYLFDQLCRWGYATARAGCAAGGCAALPAFASSLGIPCCRL